MEKKRSLFYFKTYFDDFYSIQTPKVRDKIEWTLRLMEHVDVIPEQYLKYLTGTDGLYEIRVQHGNNIFRIFSFFDKGNIIVLGHGFQKKTEKTPRKEIERAKKIKQAYYEENASHLS
jgi:phage-related protein